MVFPQDITIDKTSRKLCVLSNNLPQHMFSSFNSSETNFYITCASLDELALLCHGMTFEDLMMIKARQQDYMIFPDMIPPKKHARYETM